MRVLADTHAFLWFVFDDSRLSAAADESFNTDAIAVSKASLWEIAIKASLRKINLGRSYQEFVDLFVLQPNIAILDIEISHLVANALLPKKHKDPVDRLLAAQAISENVPVITSDPSFKAYGVKTIW
jgi:PIN domain nuclease of toxin-antitoxin system